VLEVQEKAGFVPNVFSTYSLKPQRLRNFMAMYNDIMLSPSGLSKLEREMIALKVEAERRFDWSPHPELVANEIGGA